MKSGNFIPTDKNVKYKIIIPKEEPKQSTVGKEFYESADEIITVYKQDIIQLIEDRILSEYKKHSASLPNEWAKIAAHKIYKSISDKMEEPKQHVEFINSNIEEFDEEQFKQASEYYAHNHFNMHETNNYKALKQGFKAGAKWQVERMYSEEEVQVKLYECLGHFAQKHNIIINGNEIDQWFNQFKKK
jgi:CRISPR/Cas system-associated protein Cas10 (large subunit of type III CRISPR-Cas system)